ncbi:MAG: Pr6Pr family membrane protein [Sphingomicrobium sp.]
MIGRAGRVAAAAIALVGWVGLAAQFGATHALGHTAVETLWILLRYFTILTNLVVAATMTTIALGRIASPSWIGGVTLAILLVGIIDATLLRGMPQLTGAAHLADILLHKVSPLAVPLWWLAFGTKGQLTARDPLLWMLAPLAYFTYALVRGGIDGKYAYSFIDVAQHGWPPVLLTAVLIASAFVAAGFALLLLDRRLGR